MEKDKELEAALTAIAGSIQKEAILLRVASIELDTVLVTKALSVGIGGIVGSYAAIDYANQTDREKFIKDMTKCFERAAYAFMDGDDKINLWSLIEPQPVDMDWSQVPVADLRLTYRIVVNLRKHDILTVADLLKYSKRDLCKMRSIGIKSVSYIQDALEQFGLELPEVSTVNFNEQSKS